MLLSATKFGPTNLEHFAQDRSFSRHAFHLEVKVEVISAESRHSLDKYLVFVGGCKKTPLGIALDYKPPKLKVLNIIIFYAKFQEFFET